MIPISDNLWAALRVYLGQGQHKPDDVIPLIQGLEECRRMSAEAPPSKQPDGKVIPFQVPHAVPGESTDTG